MTDAEIEIQIPGNRDWLNRYRRNLILFSMVCVGLILFGGYFLIFDFLGESANWGRSIFDYGRGHGDPSAAAIVLGIIGLTLFLPHYLKYFSFLGSIQHAFINITAKGINCYMSKSLIHWNNINSIAISTIKEVIILSLDYPVPVFNLSQAGREFKGRVVVLEKKHLDKGRITLEQAKEIMQERLEKSTQYPALRSGPAAAG